MATIRKLRGRWQAQVRRRGMKPRCKSFDSMSIGAEGVVDLRQAAMGPRKGAVEIGGHLPADCFMRSFCCEWLDLMHSSMMPNLSQKTESFDRL